MELTQVFQPSRCKQTANPPSFPSKPPPFQGPAEANRHQFQTPISPRISCISLSFRFRSASIPPPSHLQHTPPSLSLPSFSYADAPSVCICISLVVFPALELRRIFLISSSRKSQSSVGSGLHSTPKKAAIFASFCQLSWSWTKLTATPTRPKRPVRPMRCR